MSNSNTDVVYQEVQLYLEGIQVPYQSISITTQADGLPAAFLTLSPTLGMEDIARYYQPKVHVFAIDPVNGKIIVLFTGQIDSVSYTKSTGVSSYREITYECTHRYHLLKEIRLLYASYTQEGNIVNANTSDATIQVNRLASAHSLITAMKGVTGVGNPVTQTKGGYKGEPDSLPSDMSAYQRRLSGIPGIFWNLWSQLKAQSYNYPDRSQAMTDLYIPLVEDGLGAGGLKLFKRLAGHLVIEDNVEANREDAKEESGKNVGKIVIPPALKAFTQGGLSAELMFKIMDLRGQFSGEATSLFDMFKNFLDGSEYELTCLNAPAEPGDGTGEAIDMVFKPRIPFYYSPQCNVLYPQMYESVQVQEADGGMPTRIIATTSLPPYKGGEFLSFRGPASVREAIANGKGLGATLSYSNDKVGKYEFGRGVKPVNTILPTWLSLLSSYKATHPDAPNNSVFSPDQVAALKKGWDLRYGTANENLNPWSQSAKVADFERILFTTMDYKYSELVESARLGTVNAYFNPYLIAGYPIDVIDQDTDAPCYHGYCTSITHTFTPTSMHTSVSFVGAMTYDEIRSYYIPPNHPWLDGVLNLAEKQSLINNPTAKATADTYYSQVLGVGAVAPDDLYDFTKLAAKPVALDTSGKITLGNWISRQGSNGGELNPYLTYQGGLSLVYRPIETQDSFASRFGLSFIKFSDMDPNAQMRRFEHSTSADKLRELGDSKFLDY